LINDKKTNHLPEAYQGTLLHWQKRYEEILHSDRAAVDIGIFALKIMIVTNAGALIALLASIGSFKDIPGMVDTLAESACPFFLGLMFAIFSAFLSYIYQSLVTKTLWEDFNTDFGNPEEPPPYARKYKPERIIIFFVIILVVVSYGFFGYGVWSLVSNIDGLSSVDG